MLKSRDQKRIASFVIKSINLKQWIHSQTKLVKVNHNQTGHNCIDQNGAQSCCSYANLWRRQRPQMTLFYLRKNLGWNRHIKWNKADDTIVGALRKQTLTWFMNFAKNYNRLKNEIKKNFLSFFKTRDSKHLATHNLKEIKQMPGKLVLDYDKRFKDLLSQILYP